MLAAKGWSIQFLEEDLKTSLRRKFTFKDEQKVRDLVERGSTERTLADHQALEHGISMGRGGVWLQLTGEQYGGFVEGLRLQMDPIDHSPHSLLSRPLYLDK